MWVAHVTLAVDCVLRFYSPGFSCLLSLVSQMQITEPGLHPGEEYLAYEQGHSYKLEPSTWCVTWGTGQVLM